MEKIKKITYILLIVMLVMGSCYAFNDVASVEDEMEPMKQEFETNISSFSITIAVMSAFFVVLSLFEKKITGQRIFKTKFLSNKIVRFIEVTLFIVIIGLMIYEYVLISNIYVKTIGIILSLFALYQRTSNKNRKWAYTSFILDVILYAIAVIIFN